MEDSPGSNDDVFNIMREKIRTQAQRLRVLEQYKVLCETRIAEIAPSHPLPVLPEHISQPIHSELEQELKYAKDQISRLQQELCSSKGKVPLCDNYTLPPPSTELSFAQLKELYSVLYFQYSKLIEDKKSLEQSLKAEIQASEEQRTYIEVLKQSIETNSYSGNDFRNSGKSQEELQTMSKEEFKSEELSQSWEEKMKTDRYLKEAAEALQFAEEEVSRLEEINKTLEAEIIQTKENESRLKQEVSVIKENYKKALIDIDKASVVMKKYEIENIEITEKLAKSDKNFEDLEKEYKNLENINFGLEQKLLKTQETLENSLSTCEMLKGKIKTWEEENSQIRQLNSGLEDKNEDLSDKLKEIEGKYQIVLTHVNDLESQNKTLSNSQFSLEIQSKVLNESLLTAEKNMKNLEVLFSNLKRKKKDLKNHSSLLQTNLKNAEEDNENFSLEIRSLTEKNSNMQVKISKLEEKIQSNSRDYRKSENLWKVEVDKLRDQIENSQVYNEKIEKSLKDLEATATKEKNIRVKLAEELGKVKKDYEEVNISKNFLMVTQKNTESSMITLQNELNSLKCQKKELLQELTQTSQKKTSFEEENQVLKSKNSKLSLIQSDHEETVRISSLFCSSFGSLLLSSSTFSRLVSSNFKEFIQNNLQVFKSDLKDCIDLFLNEFESVLRSFSTNHENFLFQASQLESKKIKIQELSEEVNAKNQEIQKNRLEIEDLKSDVQKEYLEKEIFKSKLEYLGQELENNKEILYELRKDYEKVQEAANSASSKILKLKRALDEEVEAGKKRDSDLIAMQHEKNLLNRVLVRLEKLVAEEELNMTYETILKENLNSTSKSALVSPSNRANPFSYELY
jgi:chromosome segregation ATPase